MNREDRFILFSYASRDHIVIQLPGNGGIMNGMSLN